ncbi:NAD-dependent epimerase/dehydratase family protein [Enemella sp. A6]|uniref:NAD-dependent epimerase/dehydratase family protein n=1 Tax=Enemella sp. A6 TaxID=3440152 RepID=UPI003EBE5270
MSNTLYIVTGCDGFVGSTIVRRLLAQGLRVRGVNRTGPAGHPHEVRVADVTHPDQVVAAFEGEDDRVVIHTAGKISIATHLDPELWRTNVEGTANVIAAARTTGVRRLVYTSSVHALPVHPGETMTETDEFGEVVGAYATTKAEATRRVLAASDLSPVVVYPSGILGPHDPGQGHLTQLVRDLIDGQMPIIVPGGHDLVDVRDVAAGTIAAAHRGESGAGYLLTGHLVSIKHLAHEVAKITGRREPWVMPMWLARATARMAETWYRLRRVPPLYTRYSLFTVAAGVRYSHAKATRELDYRPRRFTDTITDTVAWIRHDKEHTDGPADPARRA